jgi:hypothetical protein
VWLNDVTSALKIAFPNIVFFPTFHLEPIWGISDDWCGGPKTDASLLACFNSHIGAVLAQTMDRIAFSTYQYVWAVPPQSPDTYTTGMPWNTMYTSIRQRSQLPIWISETGFPGVPAKLSYFHTSPSPSTCGIDWISPLLVGDSFMTSYLQALLTNAATPESGVEAIVWWSNRDIADTTIYATCPCAPANSSDCAIAQLLYASGGGGSAGSFVELVFRSFANMGLRLKDGTPRASLHAYWMSFYNLPRDSGAARLVGGGWMIVLMICLVL